MASGDTKLSICSDSLILLGASPLSSFSEGTDAAQICDRIYDDLKDSLIAMYPWSWAFKKVQLARLVTTPVSEWKYSYQLPGDALTGVRAVFDTNAAGATSVPGGWEIHEQHLDTNFEQVWVDYQYAPGESFWPTYFVQLMKYAMCAEIAETVTDQITKAQYWEQRCYGAPTENRRGGYFRVATSIDGSNNSIEAFNDFTLIQVRY